MLLETTDRELATTDRSIQLSSTRRVLAWLTPEEIILDALLRDRRDALEFAAASIGRRHGIDPAPISRALWRREQVGSTGFGAGVAIPHARIAGLEHPVTLFMRAMPPIDFRAPDQKPVESILVIMVPLDGSGDENLQLLALVASMLSERAFRARLSSEKGAAGIRRAFAEWTDAPNDETKSRAGGHPRRGVHAEINRRFGLGHIRRRSLLEAPTTGSAAR